MIRVTTPLFFCFLILASGLPGNGSIDQCVDQTPVPPKNYFVLVMDRSGSMAGEPMRAAKQGARSFVNSLETDDECAIVAFNDKVDVIVGMSKDKQRLSQGIGSLGATGSTALYDAIAKSVYLLVGVDGVPIILCMTDGADTGSKFRLSDLQSMNIAEGILVYCLGYGSVERDKLDSLSRATGGEFTHTASTTKLSDIYTEVLDAYYKQKGEFANSYAKLSIQSFPSHLPVRIDGKTGGSTPLAIPQLEPGDHHVVIDYPQGKKWRCNFNAQPGYLYSITAREADLGYVLRVASSPKGAAVFVDGTYCGMTSMAPVGVTKKGFGKKVKDFVKELEISNLLKGEHHLRIIALPDFQFGEGQIFEFDFSIGSTHREVEIEIFKRKATFTDGEVIIGERDNLMENIENMLK